MGTWKRAAWTAVAWAMGAVSGMAQSLTVPKDIAVGQTISIGYSDPSRAGQAITVKIDNAGYPVPVVILVEITLNREGNGRADWVVPVWLVANFNAPGVDEETREINLGGAPVLNASREVTPLVRPSHSPRALTRWRCRCG